jgi:zinc D-Ala-D-Ala carboxypeptidase
MTAADSKGASRRVGAFFTAGEFGTSDVDHLPGLGALCMMFLDPLRLCFGAATIHSGFRSAQKNAAVGGAKQSRHLYDDRPLTPAADVSFELGTPSEWSKVARDLAFGYGLGGIGTYATHLHVDLGPRRIW